MERPSRLPDPILKDIVPLLPTKHAVQISLLSSEWKDLWTTVPVLDVQDSQFNTVGGLVLFVRWFIFLRRKDCLLTEFRLQISERRPTGHESALIHACVRDVISYGARKLRLEFLMPEAIPPIPQNAFCNQTLESLELFFSPGSYLVKLPEIIGAPMLKKVRISHCPVAAEYLNKVVSGCPLLENLTVSYAEGRCVEIVNANNLRRLKLGVMWCREVVLSCPNLEKLKFGSGVLLVSFRGNMPSLVKARVVCLNEGPSHNSLVAQILVCLSNVSELALTAGCFEMTRLHLLDEGRMRLPVFHNLRSLDVEIVSLSDNTIEAILHLLERSPNLRELFITEQRSAVRELGSVDLQLGRWRDTEFLKHLELVAFPFEHGLTSSRRNFLDILEKTVSCWSDVEVLLPEMFEQY